MAERASAIILSKRHILLIRRVRGRKQGHEEYYVFPGGHIEAGESAEEACQREVLEETGLHTAWLMYAFDHPSPAMLAHYFIVEVHPGILTLGGPEINKQSGDNRYILEWKPLAQVGELALRPPAVRDALAAVATENGPVHEARDLAKRIDRLKEILHGAASSHISQHTQ